MYIALYCGASLGKGTEYQQIATQVTDWMASHNYNLVYGGGHVGLMGLVADQVLAYGGHVKGVIPHFLANREVAHDQVKDLELVDTMSQRKNRMFEQADIFIALPGGIGTLEEIIEVVSWARVGQNSKPCIFINFNGFYDHIHAFCNHMAQEGFIDQYFVDNLLFAKDVAQLDDYIASYKLPKLRDYSARDLLQELDS